MPQDAQRVHGVLVAVAVHVPRGVHARGVRREAGGVGAELAHLNRTARVRDVDDPELAAEWGVEPFAEGDRQQRVDVIAALEQVQLVHVADAVAGPEGTEPPGVTGIRHVPELDADLNRRQSYANARECQAR